MTGFNSYRLTIVVAAMIIFGASASWAAVWVSGANTVNQRGVYGTKGVPDANNVPGARQGSASSVDPNGGLWLFGGYGFGKSGGEGYLSDLWKYDPSGGMWTWIAGPNTVNQVGIYGTKGQADTGNSPGGRGVSVAWTDNSGNLWLFGGYGCDRSSGPQELNDLWKFEPASGMWTWVSGSDRWLQHGVYGTKGEPNSTNVPGARSRSISWTDSIGNLWLFGGSGCDSTSCWNYLNDLWKFEPAAALWTWVSGSDIGDQRGVYGTKGEPNVSNMPGARSDSVSWMGSDGFPWLFGGNGFDNSSSGRLNDLWRFDPSNNLWTWVGGSSSKGQAGVYGTKGEPNLGNVPGARYQSTSCADKRGDFWLFGGQGYVAGGESMVRLNDLWRYEPSTGLWTWVAGSNVGNQAGVYGTKGEPNSANMPGGRNESTSWIGRSGSLWLFGGYGIDASGTYYDLNDLWRFDCKAPAGDIDGDCDVDFIDLSLMASHWLQKGQYN